MLAAAFLSDGLKTCGDADNGKNGIELAKELKPDLSTLLDLLMAVMNGLRPKPQVGISNQFAHTHFGIRSSGNRPFCLRRETLA
jgi:chemotaxis response regulator CheB